MLKFQHAVVGGGVVGLAVARRLAVEGPTLLLEKNDRLGDEVSSHNSEVIHAGIYYPATSLKAMLCVRGKQMTYNYLSRRNIPYTKIGKWIVATSELEREYLQTLRSKAKDNGVRLEFLSKQQLAAESKLSAIAGLDSPETGVMSAPSFIQSLDSEFGNLNGIVQLSSRVVDVQKKGKFGYHVSFLRNGEIEEFETESLILSCGLGSSASLKQILKEKFTQNDQIYYLKGHYFRYSGPPLMNRPRLVYPVPDPSIRTLGIHSTISLDGSTRFGPDKCYVDSINYSFGNDRDISALRKTFAESIQRYFPSVQEESLHPDFCGIRPSRASPDDTSFKDFLIQEESSRAFPDLITLLGIESPGLTSALAIGDHVAQMLNYRSKDI